MITPLNEYIKVLATDINKNSNLEFLKVSLELKDTILLYGRQHFTNKIKYSNISKEYFMMNFIKDDDTALYLSDELWIKLYDMLKKRQSDELKEKLNSRYPSVKNMKIIKVIEAYFTNLYEDQPILRNDDLLAFQHKPANISLLLYKQLQNIIISKAVRKEFKYNLNRLYLKQTSTAYTLGMSLFMSFIQTKNNFLKRILFNTSKIALQDLEKFELLIIAIINNDSLQTFEIIKGLYGFDIISNKTIYNLLQYHIMVFTLEHFIKKNPNFYTLNEKLANHPSYSNYTLISTALREYKENSNSIFIKLGAPIIEALKDAGLITIEKKYLSATNQPNVIYFDRDETIFDFISSEIYYIPYFTESTRESSESNVDDIYNNVHIYANQNIIHKHADFQTLIPPGSYLDKPLSLSKLTIDDDFLAYFLKDITSYLGQTYESISQDPTKNLSLFLSLFDISLEETFNFDNDIEKKISIDVINYSLNFNILYDKSLLLSIKNKLNTHHEIAQYYLKVFYKIVSYKTFLAGMLKDSIIYSTFGYFMFPIFLDSRLRKYMHGYYLNLQNFPIIRAFVKFYDPTKVNFKENFFNIKDALKSVLYDISSINQLENMSYDDYLQQNKNIELDIIYAALTLENLELLSNFISSKPSLEAIKLFVIKFIKDKTQTFVITSFIYRIVYPNTIVTNILGLDACNSGIQLVSILFKTLETAVLTNLTGTNTDGIYKVAVKTVTMLLNELKNLLDTFRKEHEYEYIYSNKQFYSDINLSWSLNDKLNFFFNGILGSEYYFRNWLDGLSTTIHFKPTFNAALEKFSFLILPSEYSILNKEKQNIRTYNSNMTSLMILRNAFRFFRLCELLRLDYNALNHKMFKNQIMTKPYNATSFGRKDTFREYLENNVQKLASSLNSTDYNIMSEYLEGLFQYFDSKYLDTFKKLNELSLILSKTTKPITIEHRYATINFLPYNIVKETIITRDPYTGKRKRQLYSSRAEKDNSTGLVKIDPKKIKQKFGANFIHTMDSYIVHLFSEKIDRTNALLYTNNIFINTFTNHDAFYTTWLPFLYIIVRDCYIEIYDLDYIKTLRTSLNEDEFKTILALQVAQDDINNYFKRDFNLRGFIKA